jgi:hypothetical protein
VQGLLVGHRLLREAKHAQLDHLSEQLRRLETEDPSGQGSHPVERVRQLLEMRRLVDAEPEWPLSLQTGAAFLVTVVVLAAQAKDFLGLLR